jgi:hypothetical protein
MIIKEDKWSQFGHYTVGNDPSPIYHLKLALEKRKATGGIVNFIYHDDVYKAAQPTINPPKSLLELYTERVRQLRTKYDYLVLMYSGGADSHNILKCFEHSDTKLDEIVSFVDSSYKSKDSKISSEIYRVAVPEVQQYQLRYPETEYKLIEMREVQKQLLNDTAFKFDHYQDTSYHLIPFGLMHHYGLYYIQKYHQLHSEGKRVGVIHGIDKIKLKVVNNRWGFQFTDWSSHFGHKHYFRDYPIYDEFFYWSPDLPELSIKQAHVASKYFDYLDSIKAETKYRDNEMANVTVRKSGVKTNWEYANHIIYPFWKQGTYSTGKTFESYISNGRDDTLTRSNDELLRTYKHAVIKTLMLANETGHGLTPNQLSDAADVKTIIGVRPRASVTHFIE